jgi:hypothetical protein
VEEHTLEERPVWRQGEVHILLVVLSTQAEAEGQRPAAEQRPVEENTPEGELVWTREEVHMLLVVVSTQAEAEARRREVEQTPVEQNTLREVLIQEEEPTLAVVVRPGEAPIPEELTLVDEIPVGVLIQGEELTLEVVVRLGEAPILGKELTPADEIPAEASIQEGKTQAGDLIQVEEPTLEVAARLGDETQKLAEAVARMTKELAAVVVAKEG